MEPYSQGIVSDIRRKQTYDAIQNISDEQKQASDDIQDTIDAVRNAIDQQK